MRIALAQMNPTVGDLDGNAAKILEAAQFASEDDVDLVVFPAHALTGWPLDGLAYSDAFLADVRKTLEGIAEKAQAHLLLSAPRAYELFDDFAEPLEELIVVDNHALNSLGFPQVAAEDESFGVDFGCDGISICFDDHFDEGVAEEGDTVLLEMCADTFDSPYALPAAKGELDRIIDLAKQSGRFVAYVNLTGASDATVFAGGSCIVTPEGELIAACSSDKQEIVTFDTKPLEAPETIDAESAQEDDSKLMWDALVMATRDYMNKNGFGDALVGLSGGIDSAVVAAVAADAIGAEHVHAVLMPSKYSSDGSVQDALELAHNFGIETLKLPINEPVESFHQVLGSACGGEVSGLAAENLQARVRTVYLMTLSNARGWMLLNTGNKSEAAMGFSTLYGDTAGAYAPIGDLYKTQVYELARWRAAQSPSIPEACITKAPSAELYEGAKDSDRLPEYELLDTILAAHVEGEMGAAELIEQGFDPKLVKDVLRSVQRSEYKRRMEPMAAHLGGIALNDQRSWPVTNGWIDD